MPPDPQRRWQAPLDFPAGLPPAEPPPGFADRAAGLGIEFDAGDLERLGRYLSLLIAANRAVNLTAIRDPADAWERHILDSLALLPVLAEIEPAGERLRVIDVGSGGGLPGLPLACCMPGAEVTLLDATAKKCRFLEHAARELSLANVRVLHDRAEHAARDRGAKIDEGGLSRREGALRDAFDAAVARAVGRMATLLELTSPFVRPGGLCVLTKGEKAAEELAEAKGALHMLHCAHAGTVEVPTGKLVVVEKLRPTPRLYPRPDGEPKRKPLGAS